MLARALSQFARYARIAGIVILLAVLGIIGYQAYDFYNTQIGFTPAKTVEGYFSTLAAGNYEEVYRLTAKDGLTDIYGRPITHDEFIDQVKQVTGGRRLPFQQVRATQIFRSDDSYYFRVDLTANVGGSAGASHLIVEVHREDEVWVVTYPFAIVL